MNHSSFAQGSLFDDPGAPGPARPFEAVIPASPDPGISELARDLPEHLRFGTSSWSFPGWAGIVYSGRPDEGRLARDGLPAYAAHPLFRTVGLDRTFYSPIGVDQYRRYADQVPPSFRFLVKAPMQVTASTLIGRGGREAAPNPAFMDGGLAVESFVARATTGLGARLGPLVFQFPPVDREWLRDPEAFAARLRGFLLELPRGPLYAIELRNRELVTRAYAAALDATGARHCVSVHPGMPGAATQARVIDALAPGPLVVRWNLHRAYGYEAAKSQFRPFNRLVDPDPETRTALAGLARRVLERGEDVYIVANNKAEGCAPHTLAELARAIAGSR